eukprot:6214271-Pleurochrysis_carterae.AAC.3
MEWQTEPVAAKSDDSASWKEKETVLLAEVAARETRIRKEAAAAAVAEERKRQQHQHQATDTAGLLFMSCLTTILAIHRCSLLHELCLTANDVP